MAEETTSDDAMANSEEGMTEAGTTMEMTEGEEAAPADMTAAEAASTTSEPMTTSTTEEKVTSTKTATNNTSAPSTTSKSSTTPAPTTTTKAATTQTATTKSTATKTSTPTKTTAAKKPPRPTLSHATFDQLLRKYVSSSGKVDYDAFKRNKVQLGQYLEILKNNPPQSSWSKNKEMAYWINMYNAFTIYSIVEKYPVKSIMDLEGGKVWDKKKIKVGGQSLSLNMIEKDKLLKRFKEPRVHFAVNCAAASCPPLLNKAWTEDNIQRYYEQQTKAFINNTTENTISAKKLEISQIFNWYAGDFGGSDKIVPYFQKYSNTTIKNNAKVSFKEYKWELNKK